MSGPMAFPAAVTGVHQRSLAGDPVGDGVPDAASIDHDGPAGGLVVASEVVVPAAVAVGEHELQIAAVLPLDGVGDPAVSGIAHPDARHLRPRHAVGGVVEEGVVGGVAGAVVDDRVGGGIRIGWVVRAGDAAGSGAPEVPVLEGDGRAAGLVVASGVVVPGAIVVGDVELEGLAGVVLEGVLSQPSQAFSILTSGQSWDLPSL